jgi:hypothetical protein
VATFQQKTPESSALVTVFLGEGIVRFWSVEWGVDGDVLSRGGEVLVGGEHYVGRVEG